MNTWVPWALTLTLLGEGLATGRAMVAVPPLASGPPFRLTTSEVVPTAPVWLTVISKVTIWPTLTVRGPGTLRKLLSVGAPCTTTVLAKASTTLLRSVGSEPHAWMLKLWKPAEVPL